MLNDSLTKTPASPFAGLRNRIAGFFDTLVEASGPMRATREFERLSRLSDAELASRGLKRDRLIEHAFRRYVGL